MNMQNMRVNDTLDIARYMLSIRVAPHRAARVLASAETEAEIAAAGGFEYGLGDEIGINTDKLHARGPVGLEGPTSHKFVVFGDGHILQ